MKEMLRSAKEATSTGTCSGNKNGLITMVMS